jgi:hypothetical protein
VRVYRGLYDRRHKLPADVSFGDLVTAEQTLAAYIASYVTALGMQWTATVDVANLLQTDDFFQAGKKEDLSPVPDLDKLAPLPCEHPCVPIPEKKWLHGADGDWPPPEGEPKPKPPGKSQQSQATPPRAAVAPASARPVPLRQVLPTARRMPAEPAALPAELLEPPPGVPKVDESR